MKKKILLSPLLIIVLVIMVGVGAAGAAILIGGGGATGNVNLQKGLVAQWKMDGNAKDATPNSNHGTLNGNAAVTASDRKGQANKAATFDGVGDFVDAGSGSSLSLTGAVTVAVWIKKGANDSYYPIVAKGHAVTSASSYVLRFHNDNTIQYALNNYGVYRTSSTTLTDTAGWHHIVGVYNPSANLDLYIDGVLSNGTLSGVIPASITNTTDTVKMGTFWSIDFTGLMDDVRVYNRAITATEITALYESYNPGIVVSDLQKGLVAQWKMDGNAKDSTPNSNHGTLNGNAAVTASDRKGQANKAATFDGVGDYVTAVNSSSLNITANQMSISVWAKATTSPGTFKYLASKVNNDATVGYALYTGSDGNLRVFVIVGGVGQLSADAGSGIWDGTWKHLLGIYNNGTLLIYVNGIQAVSTSVTAGNITSSSAQPFNIGSYNDSGLNGFNGQIDDVRIYNRALSPTEITALYESYNPGIVVSDLQKGLVGNWKLDGNTKDATPQSNHGTAESITFNTADRKGHNSKAGGFNGTSDYVNVGDSNSLDITGAITLSAWVNNTNAVGATLDGGIVWKSAPLYGLASQKTYEFGFLDGSIYFQIGDGTNSETVGYAWVGSGSWQHMVATWDGTTGSTAMNIYVNGVLKATDNSTTVASIRATTDPLKIGGRSGGQSYEFFAGSIDDVRVYNRVLSATEITALYQSY